MAADFRADVRRQVQRSRKVASDAARWTHGARCSADAARLARRRAPGRLHGRGDVERGEERERANLTTAFASFSGKKGKAKKDGKNKSKKGKDEEGGGDEGGEKKKKKKKKGDE